MRRTFKYKTLPMLIASLTVADHFETEKEAFVNEMPGWADPFIDTFRAGIQLILETYFGIRSKESLQDQTQLVNELTQKAKYELDMVKTQIERGFRQEPLAKETLLSRLGYDLYWSQASNNNQEMMISLLLTFANHMDEALKSQLLEKQVNAVRVENILGYADQLNQANITQESLKGTSKLATNEAVAELNETYAQAMDICAIGKILFRHDPLKRELFVFSKLVRNQGASRPDELAATEMATE